MGIWVGQGILVRREVLDLSELEWLLKRTRRFIHDHNQGRYLEFPESLEWFAEDDPDLDPSTLLALDNGKLSTPGTYGERALELRTWPGSSLLGISLAEYELVSNHSGAGGFWDDPSNPREFDTDIAKELSQRGSPAWVQWYTELDVAYPPEGATRFSEGEPTWEFEGDRTSHVLEHAFGIPRVDGSGLEYFWASSTLSIPLDGKVNEEHVAALQATRAGEPVTEALACFEDGFPEEVRTRPESTPEPPDPKLLAAAAGGPNDAKIMAFVMVGLLVLAVLLFAAL